MGGGPSTMRNGDPIRNRGPTMHWGPTRDRRSHKGWGWSLYWKGWGPNSTGDGGPIAVRDGGPMRVGVLPLGTGVPLRRPPSPPAPHRPLPPPPQTKVMRLRAALSCRTLSCSYSCSAAWNCSGVKPLATQRCRPSAALTERPEGPESSRRAAKMASDGRGGLWGRWGGGQNGGRRPKSDGENAAQAPP